MRRHILKLMWTRMKRGHGGEGSGAGTQGVYRLATPVHRHESQTRGVIAVHRLSMIKAK